MATVYLSENISLSSGYKRRKYISCYVFQMESLLLLVSSLRMFLEHFSKRLSINLTDCLLYFSVGNEETN